MYRLPADLDLSFLANKELFQVCFGAHDLILNFSDVVSISVTSCLGWVSSTGSRDIYEDFSKAAPALLTLLHDVVTSAHGDPAGTLSLKFRLGITLEIYDNSDRYESYLIKNGDQLIVV